jgi:SOS response regulatory protein OraA/RecX
MPRNIVNQDEIGACDLAHAPTFIAPSVAAAFTPLTSGINPPLKLCALALPLSLTHSCYASLMFGTPRQFETETQLYDAAIKILMRRAHSVSEMKKALARRCEDEKLVKTVVGRLKRENLIDDARYARQFTQHRVETRKQGPFRIARELRARGVPDKHIAAALKDSAAEIDPAAIVRQRIERKLRTFRGEIDQKKAASLYRSLIGAGFPDDLVRHELERMTKEEVPEADEQV